MKYLRLFESTKEEEFKDIDDYMEEHYENYFDDKETFDSLIEKLDTESVENFIEETYRTIENDISEDICNHCDSHPYIDTSRGRNNNDWNMVLISWVETADAPKEVADKLKSEMSQLYWEDIMRKAIDEEPLNYFKLKDLDIYEYLEDEKNEILADYEYLNRGGGSELMSAKMK